jgi:hypothetical protein
VSQFNHLVEINDPHNPLIDMITREQLWTGLVRRAEEPAQFVMGLDACRIVSRTGETLKRELRFGSLIVRDSVTFSHLESVCYEVEATDAYPASTLIMRIEEPKPERLFVRFEYSDERPEPDDEDEEEVKAMRALHSAYKAADIDTIRGIRRFVNNLRYH